MLSSSCLLRSIPENLPHHELRFSSAGVQGVELMELTCPSDLTRPGPGPRLSDAQHCPCLVPGHSPWQQQAGDSRGHSSPWHRHNQFRLLAFPWGEAQSPSSQRQRLSLGTWQHGQGEHPQVAPDCVLIVSTTKLLCTLSTAPCSILPLALLAAPAEGQTAAAAAAQGSSSALHCPLLWLRGEQK